MTNILIVDDEAVLGEVLAAYFIKEGWQPTAVTTGAEALKEIKKSSYDLMILDLMLPDLSGEDICQLTREISDIPIIMLTAKTKEDDLINGLMIGADDYIKKPFSSREVVVRIKTLLRRKEPSLTKALQFNNGHLLIDLNNKTVQVNGKMISLTPNEYYLLVKMAEHVGRVYSRTELLKALPGDEHYLEGYQRNIDTHIKNLRKKLNEDPRQPCYIHTVFGMGYKFEVNTLD
ncbi:response regulator transcription factor [Amphibacillus jilinensis]|uniref:response regulator transcription factor n=1 Tax=Amphibacillus jilinensis TaxID=1216008 RepID=UPI0002EB1B4D|nr:response regulator transcription factor [Amphibacillus jilinensis]